MNEVLPRKTIIVRKFLASQLGELHPRLQRFVCPIFGVDCDFGMPRLIGSGVLVKVGSRSFLITAAHVLDEDAENNFNLITKSGLVGLEGTITRIVAPLSGREHDRLDMSFVLLAESVAVELAAHWAFLGPEDLDMNEEVRAESVRVSAVRFRRLSGKPQQRGTLLQDQAWRRDVFAKPGSSRKIPETGLE